MASVLKHSDSELFQEQRPPVSEQLKQSVREGQLAAQVVPDKRRKMRDI
jgi:hypothetical protein